MERQTATGPDWEFVTRAPRSLWGDAWRRLISSNTARVGMAVVIFFLVATLITHFFWPYEPTTDSDFSMRLEAPTLRPSEIDGKAHPFGTDSLGRDVLRRVAHGGWNSLRVGLVSVGIALSVGGFLGLLAGFYETMPIGKVGLALLTGFIGLLCGGLLSWISGQPTQTILFALLGAAAPFAGELLPLLPVRILVYAGLGLLLGGGPALWVSPYTAAVCGLLGLLVGGMLALPISGAVLASIIMRTMDVILAFPGILLAIVIVSFLGAGLDKGMIAIGVVSIPTFARLVRSTVLQVVQLEYVLAAQSVGVNSMRILLRHIVPNSLSPVIVQATMGLASAILWAGALGFLGLGAIPPEPEWGAMLGNSYRYLTAGAWWAVLFPGLAIMLSVLGFNLLGDGLRDALDPRLRI